MSGGISAVTVISAISAAATIYSATQKGKSSSSVPLPPPAAPIAPPTLNTPQIEAAGEMERRKAAAAGGIMENIRTSPLGDQSIASTTGKSLLGQ